MERGAAFQLISIHLLEVQAHGEFSATPRPVVFNLGYSYPGGKRRHVTGYVCYCLIYYFGCDFLNLF
jgi:hypothetical protein